MPDQLTLPYILLLPILGVVVGAIGSTIGLGGGFILVPILLALFPEASTSQITFTSLTAVFVNACASTINNFYRKRIDFPTAAILMCGAIPAAIGVSLIAQMVTRTFFESLFGCLMLAGAIYISRKDLATPHLLSLGSLHPNRYIKERSGVEHFYSVNNSAAALIGPVAGFVSSFFGIGGGTIHIPAMNFLLGIPLRIAGATAMLVLVSTSSTALATLFTGYGIVGGYSIAGLLAIGTLCGGQFGIYAAGRIQPRGILLILSIAMGIAGLGLIIW